MPGRQVVGDGSLHLAHLEADQPHHGGLHRLRRHEGEDPVSVRPYRLVRPCPKCPFRTDVEPYLRPERVTEIVTTIQQGAEFHCHETTVHDDDVEGGMTADATSAVCAGSVLVMEHMDQPNQALRVAERLGLYDRDRMDLTAPVHHSWVAMQDHFSEDDEGETCSYVGPGCEAPAGYMIGGAAVRGTDYVDTHCEMCEEPVCETCLGGLALCPDCAGEDDD